MSILKAHHQVTHAEQWRTPAIPALTNQGKGDRISKYRSIPVGAGALTGKRRGTGQDLRPNPLQRAAGPVRGGGAGRGIIPWELPPQRPFRASRRGRVMPAIASSRGRVSRQREWYRRVFPDALSLDRETRRLFLSPAI